MDLMFIVSLLEVVYEDPQIVRGRNKEIATATCE
jgi:hypothetical protein